MKSVHSDPLQGREIPGANNDPRFPKSAGFQKMDVTQRTFDGQTISAHYQYNSMTGKAYDVKIATPQRSPQNPKLISDKLKAANKAESSAAKTAESANKTKSVTTESVEGTNPSINKEKQ